MIPGDEVDNDCDHIIDEEIFDGKDDDDDSYIDEDVKEVNQMTHDGILHWIVKDIYQLRNFPWLDVVGLSCKQNEYSTNE